MSGVPLLLRWSWRDLRQRWLLVTALALVIGLGTGTYAALMSTSEWRRQSNDLSFAQLHVHDLRVALAQGTTVPEGTLLRAVQGIPDAAAVSGARERLVVPIQVARGTDLLVPGELVGTATAPGAIAVDGVSSAAGQPLTAAAGDAGRVVVERAFADKNHLPATGQLTVSGGRTVDYVGHGQSPEYFLVTGGLGGTPFLSQKSYGVLFTTLHGAQRILGAPARVNDVVLTLRPGADRDAVETQLRHAVTAARPAFGADVTTRDDIAAYRVLYDDIDGDARLWRIVALLILAGAAFATLNLTTRIVEAQRREIGVGMALGVSARRLAVRPLLFGAQVSLFGVAVGVGVGLAVGSALRSVFVGMLPLPVWRTPFQLDVFGQAAALGFVLPFLAVLWPVLRAVRVQPVEAIRVGHLAARGRLAGLASRIPLPGRSWRHIPVRNLLRTPRRTVLTALGIGAAITTLVTVIGFLDTFTATLDRSERELLRSSPQRVEVVLTDLEPVRSPTVAAIRALPEVASASTGLRFAVTGHHAGHSVDLLAETIGPGARWRPTIVRGQASGGLVLAEKAARDLHVGVGDTIRLEHPRADAAGRISTVTTSVPVAGLHPNPMRVYAYLDADTARLFGLAGVTNSLAVTPAAGASTNDVRRALLEIDQVASAEAVTTAINSMHTALDEYVGVLRVGAAITLLLALLIAFNTASIATDERARDNATMLAFGLPVRSVLGLTVVETAMIGLLGAILGTLGGYGLLAWTISSTVPAVMPEIGVTTTLAGTTVALAIVLGVLTVAVAPLFTARRIKNLDLPATLRVVE